MIQDAADLAAVIVQWHNAYFSSFLSSINIDGLAGVKKKLLNMQARLGSA